MNPETIFCPNLECPARDQVGRGNIGVHSPQEHRYICHECGQTFSDRKGTIFLPTAHGSEVGDDYAGVDRQRMFHFGNCASLQIR